MLLSPRKNGLTSLFKEVRVFKGRLISLNDKSLENHKNEVKLPPSRCCSLKHSMKISEEVGVEFKGQ